MTFQVLKKELEYISFSQTKGAMSETMKDS